MGRIMHTQKTEKGEYNIVAGIVTSVNEGQGEVAGKVVNVGVTLNPYNRDKMREEKQFLSIAFWNDADSTKPQLADRVKRAKVSAGSFLFFRTGKIVDAESPASDGTPRFNTVGFDFQYNCKYEIAAEESQPVYNIIAGTARNVRKKGEYYQINIPVERRVNGNKETTWYGVSFTDSEKNRVGSRAEKAIHDGTPVCILSGSITDRNSSNGSVYHNAYGFEFVCGFAPNNSENRRL